MGLVTRRPDADAHPRAAPVSVAAFESRQVLFLSPHPFLDMREGKGAGACAAAAISILTPVIFLYNSFETHVADSLIRTSQTRLLGSLRSA